MGLRNAFEEIGLESTLRQILRAVTYARTTTDAMRVQVENPVSSMTASVLRENSSAGTATTLWMTGPAVFMVDEREQQRIQSEQQFNAVRQGRWTFS